MMAIYVDSYYYCHQDVQHPINNTFYFPISLGEKERERKKKEGINSGSETNFSSYPLYNLERLAI